MGLPIRGSDAQLSAEVDRSAAVATSALVSETRRDVDQAPRRNSELLPDQGALRSRRGHQWQHPHVDQPGTRLQEHALSTVESEAYGRHEHRIRRFSENQESRVECRFLQIPAQRRFLFRGWQPAASGWRPIDPAEILFSELR